ncbi:MAG TPA: hypothetical protein VFL78_04650 [Rhodanobacteraceae bacterium]|nr:hypothetical protein [Rhodanobacteraceae bacterium]
MRIVAMVIGIILLAAGIWVIAGNGSYPSTDTALKVGDFSVQTTHDKAIPTWAGIAGIVVGGVLLIGGVTAGGRRKR